jgi:hypothetical protein
MFRAGGSNGWISSEGVVAGNDRDGLHRLVAKLTARIEAAKQDCAPADNPRIPSGYTYLLQFIAHDMVDSVAAFSIDSNALSARSRNARSAPLLLDTLYGSGPDQCPQAYEYREDNTLGKDPRTHMRLGPRSELAPPGNRYCPFHDIARSTPNSKDEGQPRPPERPVFTEAMLADSRNDAHALISQLTVLFQRLHNHVLSLVEEGTSSISSAHRELTYRRFHCARLVVTLMYRNIIEKDVLCKILDRRIYDHYVTNGNPPRDNGESIPLEFTFGAFRFGHSMVRGAYNVNSQFEEQDVTGALLLSSQQRPDRLPVTASWFIDWDRFFIAETPARADEALKLNFSKMIGLHYVGDLQEGMVKVPGLDAAGLAQRDLLSACYSGMLSVTALCSELRARGFEREVVDFSAWRSRLDTWLPRLNLFPSSDDDRKRVVEDPPLPFFVLFEAEHYGGQHLGPVGSIIVAETILGAFKRHPLGVEQRDSTLQQRISRCGELYFDESSARGPVSEALSQIDEIETMPQLLEYMRRLGCFG